VSWVTWRQYRFQAALAAALLAAFAGVILVDGLHVAAQWHTMLVGCAGNIGCLQQQQPRPTLVNGVVSDLPYISLIVPAVLGMLWGAPLVAHELETRTSDFAWAQSVTRTRWLIAKAGWLLLSAAVCGGVISVLTTWWSGPTNALQASAFQPGQFDTQGIVPIGYAVFAMALGIAAGTVARRTLPGIAVALGGFIGLRLVISDVLRPHYMAAVTTYYKLTNPFTPAGQAWVFSQGAVSRTGQVVAQGWGDLYPALPASCQRLMTASPAAASKSGNMSGIFSCMQANGWRGFVTYQPASRYWPFQGIETVIYLVLAAALIAVTFVIVRRRDA